MLYFEKEQDVAECEKLQVSNVSFIPYTEGTIDEHTPGGFHLGNVPGDKVESGEAKNCIALL